MTTERPTLTKQHTPIEMERFWSKVNKTETCWLWTANVATNGYGRFYINGKSEPAHRVAYEAAYGPVPIGLTLDHLCFVRRCVNPDHLAAVTQRENLARSETASTINRRKTHCPRGHAYTTYNGRTKRRCRTCHKMQERNRRAKV